MDKQWIVLKLNWNPHLYAVKDHQWEKTNLYDDIELNLLRLNICQEDSQGGE